MTVTVDIETKTLPEVLNGLMRRYKERVPDVSGIIEAMMAEGIIDRP
ncbi:MAG: DUF1338 domain-containing protein, partial [Deinococcota bacterium]|nr:DUF1338 domain-containing protein [Deinococcota bacterium]